MVATTGFASTDYSTCGNAAIGVFLALTFVGGCTGSTSRGIKIFRSEVMSLMLRTHFVKLVYPSGVFLYRCGDRTPGNDVVHSVVAFFAVLFLYFAATMVALKVKDLGFLTSASGAAMALANVGLGLGSIIGPAGNFAALPDPAKWLLSFAMMLGRLELFTVLVLFVPGSGALDRLRNASRRRRTSTSSKRLSLTGEEYRLG